MERDCMAKVQREDCMAKKQKMRAIVEKNCMAKVRRKDCMAKERKERDQKIRVVWQKSKGNATVGCLNTKELYSEEAEGVLYGKRAERTRPEDKSCMAKERRKRNRKKFEYERIVWRRSRENAIVRSLNAKGERLLLVTYMMGWLRGLLWEYSNAYV